MKRTGYLLCICFLLTQCSLTKHLEKVSSSIEEQYAATRTWDELPQRTISWQQAVALMRRNNHELRRVDMEIDRAERETISVYTDMIPRVAVFNTFDKTLSELTDSWSGQTGNTNINVTFSIPTLTQVPYRVYAAMARDYAAKKSKEGKERELISQLYHKVRLKEIATKKQELQRRTTQEDEQKSALTELTQEGSEAEEWTSIAKLLGDYSARWQILPETMPHIRWQDYEHRLNKLDPLLVCQFAMQLEQARMQQYSVALQYLPTINVGLYSPSLFSSSGGTYSGTFLDSKDTHLNFSTSYVLDTQLRQWNNYKDSKANLEMKRAEIAAELISHKEKIATLRKSVTEYENWRGFMTKRLNYLRTAPAPTAAEFIEQQKAIYSMEQELLTQEEKAVESEAALVLGYGLP